MESLMKKLVLPMIIGLMLGVGGMVASAQYGSFNRRCNGNKYVEVAIPAIMVSEILGDLIKATPSSAGRDYHDYQNAEGIQFWGHATCSQSITADECTSCLTNATQVIATYCQYAMGAKLTNNYCKLRYEAYKF